MVEEHDAVQSVRVFRRADMSEIEVPRPAEIGVMDLTFAQGAANRDPSATVLQLRFSAYDNVTAKPYPAMYVAAALHDSQVKYHEQAKWVAKLRFLKTDGHELLFVTELEAGHTGTAGRFGSIDENAHIVAWLITQSNRR